MSQSKKEKFDVKVGMRIIIEVDAPVIHESADNDDVPKKLSLNSYVEDTLDGKTMLIQMPMFKGFFYPPPRNRAVTAYFFVTGRMFALDIIYMHSVTIGKLEYAKVRRVGELTPFQRRECFRLECTLPIFMERLPREGEEMEDDAPSVVINCSMVNLSDGGILFAADEELETGDKLVVTITIDGNDEVLNAEMIRSEPAYGVGLYKRRNSAKFIHKSLRQKDKIYKYIVNQQREILNSQMRD